MTKEELQEYRFIKEELRQLDAEREYWYSKAEKSTRSYDGIHVSGGKYDTLPDIMDKLNELGDIASNAFDRLIERRQQIEDAISNLDGAERFIVRGRYIEAKTWETLAEEMGYSPESVPWLHKIHGRALKKLAMESNALNVV